jgi:hypothetical protein
MAPKNREKTFKRQPRSQVERARLKQHAACIKQSGTYHLNAILWRHLEIPTRDEGQHLELHDMRNEKYGPYK